MESNKQLMPILKQLLRLLKKENNALIANDGAQIEKIVFQKEQLIEQISGFKFSLSEKERELVVEIKQLQDDNLLLTRQAISYSNNFLKLVGENAQKTNATYSRKGNLSVQEDISFVNQSM